MKEALWDKKKLGVKFVGNTSLLGKWRLENGNKMTTETIINWANTWWRKCDPSNVPRFVDVDSEPGLNDDIRVEFNGEMYLSSEVYINFILFCRSRHELFFYWYASDTSSQHTHDAPKSCTCLF